MVDLFHKYFFILPAKMIFDQLEQQTSLPQPFELDFFAIAIAVFIKTPSQPNSIAIDASEACPSPASIIKGNFVLI